MLKTYSLSAKNLALSFHYTVYQITDISHSLKMLSESQDRLDLLQGSIEFENSAHNNIHLYVKFFKIILGQIKIIRNPMNRTIEFIILVKNFVVKS